MTAKYLSFHFFFRKKYLQMAFSNLIKAKDKKLKVATYSYSLKQQLYLRKSNLFYNTLIFKKNLLYVLDTRFRDWHVSDYQAC